MTKFKLVGGYTETAERVLTSVENPDLAGWVYVWQKGTMKQINKDKIEMIWEDAN